MLLPYHKFFFSLNTFYFSHLLQQNEKWENNGYTRGTIMSQSQLNFIRLYKDMFHIQLIVNRVQEE